MMEWNGGITNSAKMRSKTSQYCAVLVPGMGEGIQVDSLMNNYTLSMHNIIIGSCVFRLCPIIMKAKLCLYF